MQNRKDHILIHTHTHAYTLQIEVVFKTSVPFGFCFELRINSNHPAKEN